MRCCTSRSDEADSDSQDIAADVGLSLPIHFTSIHCSFVLTLWLCVPLRALSIRFWNLEEGTAIVHQ